MSNSVFPTLPGLSWSVVKSPLWKTIIQQSVSGRELRSSQTIYPLWKFDLQYEILRADLAYGELQSLMGFFNLMRGNWDNFLYSDPDDCTALDQSFGTGNAVTRQFQLCRTYGGATELVTNLNAVPVIRKNGTLLTVTSDYTVSSTGLVTFVSAPAIAATLRWDGTYYYRVRFDADSLDFEQFMRRLWNAKSVVLYGSLGNKI